MKSLIAFFVNLVVVLASQSGTVASELFSEIEALTDANWEAKMSGEEEIWLITFYVSWCPHAQEFEPKLVQAANDLMEKGYKIKFGAVDLEQSPHIGNKYSIDGSPVVKIFFKEDGKLLATDYKNESDTEAVTKFCTNFYKTQNIPFTALPEEFSDGDLITLDDDTFDDVISSSNEIWLLKFSAPWCYHCKIMLPAWTAAAKELGAKVRFAYINADANRGLARRFGVTKLPTLKYFTAGYNKSDDDILKYTGGRTQKDFIKFANDLHEQYVGNPDAYAFKGSNALPELEEVGLDVHQSCTVDGICTTANVPAPVSELCADKSLCIVAFLEDVSSQDSQIKDLGKVMADLDDGTNIFWMSKGYNADCEKELNMTGSGSAVLGFRKGNSTYREMKTEWSQENLKAFVTDVKGNSW